MALTLIETIRLLVGDTESSPFYPVLSNDQIQALIDLYGPSVTEVARWAAISISFTIAGYNTRETTGDISVWNEFAKNYLAALENIINNPVVALPNGMMPWAGGISWSDICANNSNPDNVRSPLTQIKTCDDDDRCGCSPCGCVEFIVV